MGWALRDQRNSVPRSVTASNKQPVFPAFLSISISRAVDMTQEHPNLALLKRLEPGNLPGSVDVFADDVVFHFFNPKLPDIQGDYIGLRGLQDFFGKLAKRTNGTFKTNAISVTPVGDELVVMQNRNTMTLEDENVDIDVVLVWRIVDGRVAEVWDIPSVYSAHTPQTQA